MLIVLRARLLVAARSMCLLYFECVVMCCVVYLKS